MQQVPRRCSPRQIPVIQPQSICHRRGLSVNKRPRGLLSRSRLCRGASEPPGTGAPLRGFAPACSGRTALPSSALPARPPRVPAGLNLSASPLLMTTQGCEGGRYMQSSVGLWVSSLAGSAWPLNRAARALRALPRVPAGIWQPPAAWREGPGEAWVCRLQVQGWFFSHAT